MTELYLIAHKVRGQPAFDVASRMDCAHCQNSQHEGEVHVAICHECSGEGFWWIIPTSGHRAYPYDWQPLTECVELVDWKPMPADLEDHYPTKASPDKPKPSPSELLKALGLGLNPAKPANVVRRF